MSTADYKIENLVFEGGGIRGIAYVGAIRYLEEQNLLLNIKKIAGSSAGAITAGLLAIGCSSKQLEQVLMNMNFEDLKDKRCCCIGRCWGLANNFGVYKGKAFEDWYERFVKHTTGIDHITMKQIQEKYGIHLILCVSNLNEQKVEYISPETHPDMPLCCAVRASMGIPLVYEVKRQSGNIYVDGGLLNNYPINVFKDEMDVTLGLKLVMDQEERDNQIYHGRDEIKNIKDYALLLINSMSLQIERGYIKDNYWQRTITINTGNISSFVFDIPDETKRHLVHAGYQATKEFL